MLNSVAKYLWGSSSNEQDYTDRSALEQHGNGEHLETQEEEDWEVVRTTDKENSLERAHCGLNHRHLHCHHTLHHNNNHHHHHHSHAQQQQTSSLGGRDSQPQAVTGAIDTELLDDAAALAWSMSIGDCGQYLPDTDSDLILNCPLRECGWVNQDVDRISDTESLPESVFSACSGRSHATYHPSGQRSEPWVVAPPPCFTGSQAGELSPIASSPLENLLIEHPSMSVYLSFPPLHPFICNRPAGDTATGDLQRPEDSETREQVAENDQAQLQNDSPRQVHINVLRPRNIDIAAEIHPEHLSPQQLVKSVHLAQRIQYNKAQKMISKSKCERQNKVRECHGHAKGNSRRNKRMCPSGFRSSRFSQRV